MKAPVNLVDLGMRSGSCVLRFARSGRYSLRVDCSPAVPNWPSIDYDMAPFVHNRNIENALLVDEASSPVQGRDTFSCGVGFLRSVP